MVRKEQNIAIAVASSGIAATLLAGGRTSHSVLKLPMTFAEGQTAVCYWLFSRGRGFHRRTKAKTSLEDDDVPIDDTTTKPLFTPQEKGRKGARDKVPRLRWNPW
ncbi:hypothetical protein LAZ67_9002626 [Cordylochernes scorpioides]|uniref:ATP-dependent DNA helicase n=1 Tax=Cordylochernes scorpioides TaxID=51811 RepID=A0ABY6KXM6_9ARAC|nr:hypothetical protein LAZ67_9002626 [Cordylochernes scorpioides]